AIIYHILAPVGYLLLLLLVIRTARGGKKKKTAARKPAGKSATSRESQIIEARSDIDMFCPNCGNKLPEGAEFCIGCGKAVNLRTPEPMEVSQAASSAPSQG